MPRSLVRYQESGDLHFVTFSCYRRQQHLGSAAARDLFERSLERMRVRYELFVLGYVVMPEHVHILLGEPARGTLAKALQALKLSVAVQRSERPFRQARYYDFNVFTGRKLIEKLKYIHRNPVTRGLVAEPEEWASSSFRHYRSGARGAVEIESTWTAVERDRCPIPHLRSEMWGTLVLNKARETWATRLPKSEVSQISSWRTA